MGNCSRKMKKSVNSWYNNNRNGAIRLGSSVSCPRCNQIFEPNTSFNIVNTHFDNCLGAQGTFTNVEPSSTSSSVDLNQINFILNSVPPAASGERYIWIKKMGPNNTATWERVVSASNKTEDHVENMSLKSAKELSFEDKQKWFLCQISKHRIPWTYGADQLVINRQNLLETTLTGLKRVNLHKEVKIVFDNEQRVNDAGGLMREFVHLICLEIFAGDKGLFIRTDTQEVIYRINPRMADTPENLQLYKLIGKIIGKAMFEQITIPVQLDHLLLRQIINQEFTLEDLLHYDKQLYNSLSYIQNNTIGDSDVFDEYFVAYSPVDGSQVELLRGGSNMKITDQNKAEFIKLQLEWIGQKFIENKLHAFLEGLYQVISKETFHAFNVQELEMVINGLPFIDIYDWEANTAYKGLYSKSHQTVKWFWELMRELNQEQLSKFFHFCTGSSRVPVEGFRALQSNRQNLQKFTIESVKYVNEKTGLSAHTCFNRLELPMYTKKEIMRQHLMSILKADFIGVFGIE